MDAFGLINLLTKILKKRFINCSGSARLKTTDYQQYHRCNIIINTRHFSSTHSISFTCQQSKNLSVNYITCCLLLSADNQTVICFDTLKKQNDVSYS